MKNIKFFYFHPKSTQSSQPGSYFPSGKPTQHIHKTNVNTYTTQCYKVLIVYLYLPTRQLHHKSKKFIVLYMVITLLTATWLEHVLNV